MTAETAASDTTNAESSQRLDKWLWQTRFFKTRTLASKFVQDGNVRVTRNDITSRLDKPSWAVRPGDTLVFSWHERLRIIVVLACAARRGPASEAQTLYEDRSPPPPPKKEAPVLPFAREKGAGRPTKKDRRALSALRSKN